MFFKKVIILKTLLKKIFQVDLIVILRSIFIKKNIFEIISHVWKNLGHIF